MNWYKLAQEKNSDQLNNVEAIQNLLDNCKDIKESENALEQHNFQFKTIKDIIVVYLNNKTYIIDDGLRIRNADEWIWRMHSWTIDEYINYPDFNEQFWNNPYSVLHATSKENWDAIKKEGLVKKDRTRGIENRSTGLAIFTSENIEEIYSYGDIVIEINAPLMKSDGYMPQVNREEPVIRAEKMEALAHLIGLNDFFVEVESGIRSSTIIFFGNIPPKYLKVI